MPEPLPDWTANAVLVYGPRKSGSTLLQNLLDGSPDLLAYPAELKLKLLARLPKGALNKAAYLKETRIPEVAPKRLDTAAYRKLWDGVPGDMPSLRALLRHDAYFVQQSAAGAPRNPKAWCAKEVGGDADKVLNLWREAFPNGRVVFIMRSPLMVTRAVLNDRRRKKRRLSFRELLRETLDPMRVRAAQERYLSSGWVHAVDYERLVQDPDAAMAEIARFLGIPDHPAFRTPTLFGEPVVVATSSRQEKRVFTGPTDWREGLTRREKLVVGLGHRLSALLSLGRRRAGAP